jgi:predicted kinase
MRTIFMTYGIPASGKSTWALEQIRKEPDRFKRVNKDDLRMMLDNNVFTLENEKFTLAIRDKIVEKALRDGWDVIVDDTNFPVGGKHFLRMCEIAQKVGDVQVVEKYFEITLKEALERNSRRAIRNGVVPADVIHNMFDKHIKNKRFECQTVYFAPIQEAEFVEDVYPAVICDIDGTLAIRGDRGAFDWHKVGVDKVNGDVAYHLFGAIGHAIRRVIVSGRDSVCRPETEKWLEDNGIAYDILLMRPEGDNRKDVIVKNELYENHIKGKYNILYVIDDRDQVVELWRRLGLTCLQVAWGDF